MDINNIELENISPDLLLCHKLRISPQKRIYHPERTCYSYEMIYIQDKPDIHIINSKEYFVYPEDIIFLKPNDITSSYSYGTNLNIVFELFKDNNGSSECDFINNMNSHFIIKDANKDEYSQLIQEIFSSFEDTKTEAFIRSKALLTYLIFMLYRDNRREDACITKSIRYIDENIESKLSIEQLSNEAGLSRTHYHRIFKEHYGITPIEYINRKKMRIAIKLIEEKNIKISQIAHELGFESASYFRELFKQTFGFSPNKYLEYFIDL